MYCCVCVLQGHQGAGEEALQGVLLSVLSDVLHMTWSGSSSRAFHYELVTAGGEAGLRTEMIDSVALWGSSSC
jgi:hypothetical protein